MNETAEETIDDVDPGWDTTQNKYFAGIEWMHWRVEKYSWRKCQIEPFLIDCSRASFNSIEVYSIYHDLDAWLFSESLLPCPELEAPAPTFKLYLRKGVFSVAKHKQI